MKNVLIAIAVAIAVGLGAAFFGGAPDYTQDDVEAELMAGAGSDSQRALYATLKAEFPIEYQTFISEMTVFMNDGDSSNPQLGFELGQQFTSTLRVANAPYLAQAPADAIGDIRVASAALLADLLDTPQVCAQFAMTGGAGMTLEDLAYINMDLMAQAADAAFRAMAAGRDGPVDHPDVTDTDIAAVVSMWAAGPDVTPELVNALQRADLQDPLLCEANHSFEDFLARSEDPSVQAVSVYLARLAAGL